MVVKFEMSIQTLVTFDRMSIPGALYSILPIL
jgi:hypothetical protein